MGTLALSYRVAGPADVAAIQFVLGQCGLRSEDICVSGTHYEVAEANGRSIGVVGIENAGGAAVLLRSLAVLPRSRNAGIGRALMTRITAVAAASAKRMYLFSTGGGDYYRSLGYLEVSVE